MNKAVRARRALVGVSLLGSLALVAGLALPAGAAARPHSSTPGVTAHEIVLGTTTPETGPAAPGYDEIAPATKAVFAYINAHGGIFGRKIKDIIMNDQYDPVLTVSETKQLVEDDHIFADVGSLGTPTQLAVQAYLNTEKVPQLFVESGCACWSESKYPYTSGWQPNYVVEGKILGKWTDDHLMGRKVGYLYQDDEFGQDGVRGLNKEIPKADVAATATYQGTSAGLANGLGDQIAKLQAHHAGVVVLYTIPAATALALLAAAELNYHPQWVISSVGADPPTVSGLLSYFSKGKANGELLYGSVSNAYLAPESDSSNPWIVFSKKILEKYDPSYKSWDGNTEYGAALGFSVVSLLRAAGKHLTRKDLLSTLAKDGKGLASGGLVPLSYSSSVHYGFQGSEVVHDSDGNVIPITPIYVSTLKGAVKVYHGRQGRIPAWLKKG